jgi:hypothetical protein
MDCAPMAQLAAGIAFVVLTIALLSAAVEADGHRRPLAIWVWPLILAYSSLNGLLNLNTFLRGSHSAPAWLAPGQPAYLIALGLLVAVFVSLEARSFRLADKASNSRQMHEGATALPLAIIAAVPIMIAIAAELLTRQLGVPLLIGGKSITIFTIVMLSILSVLGLSARALSFPKLAM